MRYRGRDLRALFATRAGRMQLAEGIGFRSWPLTSRVAKLYRRTVARRTRVVTVVGSLGKSTTTRAIAAVLALPEDPRRLANSWSRVALAMLRIAPRAPHAVVEVGIAAPGQMAQYAAVVRPDVTVVTAIASEHHRSLGSLENTRDEKAWMVRALDATGTAVLNGDDPNVLWMRAATRARVVTFGFGDACDVRAADVRIEWPEGTRFTLVTCARRAAVRVQLFGAPGVYAALAALAVAEIEGVDSDAALERLQHVAPTPGRMQPVALPGGVTVLRDDFKSPLESIHAALDTFGQIPARRRIVVLGEVAEPRGPQTGLYQDIGARVAAVATTFVAVTNRTGFDAYRAGARRAGMAANAIVPGGRTPAEVAEQLRGLLQPGDVVLIKGRDTQRLDRIRLLLAGRPVRCAIDYCSLRTVRCERCPMLETGWEGRRPLMR